MIGLVIQWVLIGAVWAVVTLLRAYVNPGLAPHDSGVLLDDFSSGCLVAAALAIIVAVGSIFSKERLIIIVAWCLRILVCQVVMLHYESAYDSLDAYRYFRDGSQILDSGWSGWRWSRGTDLVPDFVVMLLQFMPRSYHGVKMVFAFFGFIGAWFFYEALTLVLGRRSVFWCAVIMMFPPIVFWGSILGKDPLMLFMLGIFAWFATYSFYGKSRVWCFGATLATVFVGYQTGMIREWAPKIFLVPFFTIIFLFSLRRQFVVSSFHRFAALMCLTGLGVMLAWWRVIDWMVVQRDLLFEFRRALVMGSSAEVSPIPLYDWIDAWMYLPYGIFSSLFRPLPLDVLSMFGIVTGLVNLILLVLVVCSILFGAVSRRTAPALGFIGLTCLVWSVVYGFISPANFGMGSRFQLQILPFMLMGCAILLDRCVRHNSPSELL